MDSDLPKLSDASALHTLKRDTTVSPALEGFIKLLARIAVEKHLAEIQKKATSSNKMASPQCGGEERLLPNFTPSKEEMKHD